MRLRTFLCKIRFWTTFIWTFFLKKMRNFWQRWATKSEANFLFLYIIRFQTYWSSEPLDPMGEEGWGVKTCTLGLFWVEFNFEHPLFELFFKKWVFLVSLSPKVNLIFHFYIHYQISNILIFGAPSSNRGGDRDMHPRTFLGEIRFWTTIIWTFLKKNAYFWYSVEAQSESNFPFLYIMISNILIFVVP